MFKIDHKNFKDVYAVSMQQPLPGVKVKVYWFTKQGDKLLLKGQDEIVIKKDNFKNFIITKL